MKSMFLASTSTVHGKAYLEYCSEALEEFFKGVEEIVFIPYARPGGISHEEYTKMPTKFFKKLGIGIKGIHEYRNPREAIAVADAVFIGGGNTFLLLEELYNNGLIDPIRLAVESGTKYMGTSAGTNVAGQTINNTNDMPIIYPRTFQALGLADYNFNPHYLDPDPASKHKGETRETRIKEFHSQSDIPVLGLREGSWVEVEGDKHILCGGQQARVFEQGKKPRELKNGTEIAFGS